MRLLRGKRRRVRSDRRGGHKPRIHPRRLTTLACLVLLGLLLGRAEAGGLAATTGAYAPPLTDFSGWRLPVPAGDWLISRGPCGAAGLFTHQCGYYEDRCAIDLTPISDDMDHVPVLAPQDGQVFFLGTRADSGVTVMLRHDDGRVSALMHLSKVVVGLEQWVARGQVVAYAGGTGSSSRPHLHFHVQPNAVERECLPLFGLDEIDFQKLVARSHNLAWPALTLPDPPVSLPYWLPLASAGPIAGSVIRPSLLVLAPGGHVDLPLAVASHLLPPQGVYQAGQPLVPVLSSPTHTVYGVPLAADGADGDFRALLQLRMPGQRAVGKALQLNYLVRQPPDSSASQSIVLISPTFVSPANWSEWSQPQPLCWSLPASAGRAPLRFRVMVVGPADADSGWIDAGCWQPGALPAGDYYWKVFVRDADGFMNRTNQRPYVFRIR